MPWRKETTEEEAPSTSNQSVFMQRRGWGRIWKTLGAGDRSLGAQLRAETLSGPRAGMGKLCCGPASHRT